MKKRESCISVKNRTADASLVDACVDNGLVRCVFEKVLCQLQRGDSLTCALRILCGRRQFSSRLLLE